jgi:hypothetical protein
MLGLRIGRRGPRGLWLRRLDRRTVLNARLSGKLSLDLLSAFRRGPPSAAARAGNQFSHGALPLSDGLKGRYTEMKNMESGINFGQGHRGSLAPSAGNRRQLLTAGLARRMPAIAALATSRLTVTAPGAGRGRRSARARPPGRTVRGSPGRARSPAVLSRLSPSGRAAACMTLRGAMGAAQGVSRAPADQPGNHDCVNDSSDLLTHEVRGDNVGLAGGLRGEIPEGCASRRPSWGARGNVRLPATALTARGAWQPSVRSTQDAAQW